MNSRQHDWYQVLGVSEDADAELMGQVYRFRVRKLHPDVGGDPEQMKLVNSAWEVLGDPASRADYDRRRAQQTRTAAHQGQQIYQEPVAEPEHVPVADRAPGRSARLLPWVLLALWLALSAGTIIYYAMDGETASVAILTIGLAFTVSATRQRVGGSSGAMWAMAALSALGTWLLWSSETTEGLVLSWLMVVWTALFVLTAEALAWRSRR